MAPCTRFVLFPGTMGAMRSKIPTESGKARVELSPPEKTRGTSPTGGAPFASLSGRLALLLDLAEQRFRERL